MILRSRARRRVYDRLRVIESEFRRLRDPEWSRYARWIEAARIEGESLADSDFELLAEKIRNADTMHFLRVIAVGESTPDAARAWALVLKMTGLAALLFFAVNSAELVSAIAKIFLPAEWNELGDSALDRKVFGFISILTFYITLSGLLVLTASRAGASESFLKRAAVGIPEFFFTHDYEVFPVLPAAIVFASAYSILAGILS